MALGTSGLPLRLPCGVPFLLGMPSFNLTRLRVPSLISPPEPAPPSLSLPEPPLPRGRLAERLDNFRDKFGREAGSERAGESGREGGRRVLFACA